MFKGPIIFAVALCMSISTLAFEPPTLEIRSLKIQKVEVKKSPLKVTTVQRPDLMGYNKPKDIFGFAQLRIVGDQFRVCCTPSGYGVKFKF